MPQLPPNNGQTSPDTETPFERRTFESYVEDFVEGESGGLDVSLLLEPDFSGLDSIGPGTCLISLFVTGSMTSGATYSSLSGDFGDVVCYARYDLLTIDLNHTSLEPDDVARAQEQFDALLRRYIANGYDAQLREDFLDLCRRSLRGLTIDAVYVLPEDLAAVVQDFAEPLNHNWDDDDEESAPEDWVVAFDMDNPAHWDALGRRIEEYNRFATSA